jgi:hypothetical protein
MSDEAKLDEVRKYRFTRLADKRYPSGYEEGQIVELAFRHAVGCPWWVPVEAKLVEVKDGVAVTEVATVEKTDGTPFPPKEGGVGDAGLSADGKDVPDAVALMFPQHQKPKKKG